LLDNRKVGSVLTALDRVYADSDMRLLVAYVVTAETGEPGAGYWEGSVMPEPAEARLRAHRLVRENAGLDRGGRCQACGEKHS
jgi:hypothetical protein